MKFSAVPVGRTTSAPQLNDPNYLRAALRECLTATDARDVVFDFQIQVRDAAELSDKIDSEIENACTEWDEAKHPFQSVATITIPPQDFDTTQQRTICEQLRYSPWHGLSDHKPLGGINRLRLGVYRSSARLREGRAEGDGAGHGAMTPQ